MTIYTIQSTSCMATVHSLGAELRSLQTLDATDEYLWSGDPTVWSGIAPILFPIVGAVKNNTLNWRGNSFAMDKHGFARKSEFEVIVHTTDSISLELRDSPESMKQFPWPFTLRVEFSLIHDQLKIKYLVQNTGSETLWFNIGSHPAFRLPLDKAQIEDYEIQFDQVEELDRYFVVNDLLSRSTNKDLGAENRFSLSREIFNEDALVFCNVKSRRITLAHKDGSKRVSVDTGGAPHLGIWAKPAAPYVCIEPWWGHADFADSAGDFDRKEEIQSLIPGHEFQTSIVVTAHGAT